MSVRSIVELNHDYAHDIVRDPEGFIQALRFYLGSASEQDAEALQRYGITVAWKGHHSDERRVVTKYADKAL